MRVLRQGMLAITPLNSAHTVRKSIGATGFVPSNYITVLLGKLPSLKQQRAAASCERNSQLL